MRTHRSELPKLEEILMKLSMIEPRVIPTDGRSIRSNHRYVKVVWGYHRPPRYSLSWFWKRIGKKSKRFRPRHSKEPISGASSTSVTPSRATSTSTLARTASTPASSWRTLATGRWTSAARRRTLAAGRWTSTLGRETLATLEETLASTRQTLATWRATQASSAQTQATRRETPATWAKTASISR